MVCDFTCCHTFAKPKWLKLLAEQVTFLEVWLGGVCCFALFCIVLFLCVALLCILSIDYLRTV